MQEIALEKTTNTHMIKADKIKVLSEKGSMMELEIEGKGVVFHGEHGSFCTEAKYCDKVPQKEFNPLTKMLEDAND